MTLADGLDHAEADCRLEPGLADGRHAVLQKRQHFVAIYWMVVLAVRMPAVGNPLRLVEDIPGVDGIPVTTRDPKKGPERLLDESPAIGGNRLHPSALHPPLVGNAPPQGGIRPDYRPCPRLAELIVSKHGQKPDRMRPRALRREALEQRLKVFPELRAQGRGIKPPASAAARCEAIQPRRLRARAVAETVSKDEPAHNANPDRSQVLQLLAQWQDPVRIRATPPPGRGTPKVPAVAEPRVVHSSLHGPPTPASYASSEGPGLVVSRFSWRTRMPI